MFTKFATAVSALALFFASPAMATDLSGKQTPDVVQTGKPISWTGFYIGGQAGYGNANHDLTLQSYNGVYCFDKFNNGGPAEQPEQATFPIDGYVKAVPDGGDCATLDKDSAHYANVDPSTHTLATLDGLNSRGFIGGGTIGADYQMGRFVIGAFGSYDFANFESSGGIPDFDASFKVSKGDEWSAGLRAGYLLTPRVLAYALVAYTQTDYKFSAALGTESGSKTVDFDGVSVGGGLEVAITNNVFLGAEYKHTFYNGETIFDTGGVRVGGFGKRIVDDLDEDKIMATLKVKLNSDIFGR